MKCEPTIGFALAYIERNPHRFLFPILPLAKTPPLIKRNLADASNDPKQLKEWHRRWSGCNWGCALAKSNVIVADVDIKPGKQGQQTYDWLDIMYGWPDTESIRTPSGGMHHYYDGPHSFALGKSGFGEDVDSPNYTLIPGCVLEGGSRYEYMTDHPSAPAAPWMLELLKKKKHEALVTDVNERVIELDQPDNVLWAIDYLQHEAPPSIEGHGGEFTMLKIAMTLRDYGISFELGLELINDHFNIPEHCTPTWAADELSAKVRNGYTYPSVRKIGAATAEAEFADDDFEVRPLDKRTAPIVARQKLERAKAKSDKASGIRPRKARHVDKKRRDALKRAAAMATPYRSE
jgi:hypothetical protein